MNKVGIGQLKHAKASAPATQISQTPRTQVSRQEKKQIIKGDSSANKEGQLAVDIYHSPNEMVVVTPIAGVDKASIKVAIQDDVLTIRGERKPVEITAGKQALVRELFWGTFSRSIVLPDHIDRKGIDARVHEHLLIVTIPKTEDFKTRIIHINDQA
ncbi:MAG: HSP20 family protein [Oceanicoccus sp.]|jgi:HSP20 family protein